MELSPFHGDPGPGISVLVWVWIPWGLRYPLGSPLHQSQGSWLCIRSVLKAKPLSRGSGSIAFMAVICLNDKHYWNIYLPWRLLISFAVSLPVEGSHSLFLENWLLKSWNKMVCVPLLPASAWASDHCWDEQQSPPPGHLTQHLWKGRVRVDALAKRWSRWAPRCTAGQLGPYVSLLTAHSPKVQEEPAASPSSTPFLGTPLRPRGRLQVGCSLPQPPAGRGRRARPSPIWAAGLCDTFDASDPASELLED